MSENASNCPDCQSPHSGLDMMRFEADVALPWGIRESFSAKLKAKMVSTIHVNTNTHLPPRTMIPGTEPAGFRPDITCNCNFIWVFGSWLLSRDVEQRLLVLGLLTRACSLSAFLHPSISRTPQLIVLAHSIKTLLCLCSTWRSSAPCSAVWLRQDPLCSGDEPSIPPTLRVPFRIVVKSCIGHWT